MKLIATARWLLALASPRRSRRRRVADPADMGTAFGLEAITTLDPAGWPESKDAHALRNLSRLESRLHRRTAL